MNPMLGFAPYIVFAVVMQVSTDLGLWLALAVAFGLGTYTFLHARSLRILDVGGIMLFGALAFYTGFVQPSLSIAHVHLAVNGGMFAIALASLVLRNEFSLPHQRKAENVDAAGKSVCVNHAIMAIWTLAFGLMTALDVVSSIYKRLSHPLDVAADLVLLVLAVVFTARCPAWQYRKNQTAAPLEKFPTIE